MMHEREVTPVGTSRGSEYFDNSGRDDVWAGGVRNQESYFAGLLGFMSDVVRDGHGGEERS